jgi:hypothetical protein
MVMQVIKGTAFGSLTVAERSGKFAVFITHNDEVRINRNNTAQIDVAETGHLVTSMVDVSYLQKVFWRYLEVSATSDFTLIFDRVL